MTRKVLLVVEGQHDEAFAAKLLTVRHAFERVVRFDALDHYWHPTVPTKYPHKGELGKRVPSPSFYESATASVAVFPAGGDSELSSFAMDTIDLLSERPAAVGFVLDADSHSSVTDRFGRLRDALAERGLPVGEVPGVVGAGAPAAGIFVVPDNSSQGTLEDILLECGHVVYGQLVEAARAYLESIDRDLLDKRDLREFVKPAGSKKAIVAAATSILKPGRTLQTSLQDNRWISAETAALASVQRFESFLVALVEPTSEPGRNASDPREG